MLDFEYTRPLPRPEMIGDRPEVAKLVDETQGARERLDRAYKGLETAVRDLAEARERDTEALAAAMRSGLKTPARQQEKRQEVVDKAKRDIEAIERLVITISNELRVAVDAVRDEWMQELQDEVLPDARRRLADVTEAWIARATEIDEARALAAWLSRYPEGKGFLPVRRPLVALRGPNNEPISMAVVEDAMKELSEPPKPPVEPVTVPLQIRGY